MTVREALRKGEAATIDFKLSKTDLIINWVLVVTLVVGLTLLARMGV